MKSFKEFLSEGLIKIDENLVKSITDCAFEYALRYLINYCEETRPDETGRMVAQIRTCITQYNLKDVSLARIYKYSHEIESNKNITFKTIKDGNQLNVIFNFSPALSAATFRSTDNSITLYMATFFSHTIDSILDGDLLSYFESTYISLLGTVKHELTHYYQYFHKYHKTQLAQYDPKKKDRNDAYYMSNVEFDPMIKTTIENLKYLKKRYPGDKKIIDYFLGFTDKPPDYYKFSRGEFLPILKRRAPEKYKKALKYIFQNI